MSDKLTTKEKGLSGSKQPESQGPGTETVKQVILNLLLIGIGSALVAVAINGILIPHQFVSGGLVGLALGFHYIFPSVSVGWLYLLMNIPLFYPRMEVRGPEILLLQRRRNGYFFCCNCICKDSAAGSG